VSLDEQTCRTRLRELSFYPSPQGAFGACRVTAGWSCLAANGASTSFAANGNLALRRPLPRVSFAYFDEPWPGPCAAHRFVLPLPRPPRSPCLRCQTSRMQARCSRCCGSVQTAPPAWYWKGKRCVSCQRRKDVAGTRGLEEAPAHNAARRGSTSSRLAAMMPAGQGSRQQQPQRVFIVRPGHSALASLTRHLLPPSCRLQQSCGTALRQQG
jgi:hypothetical protein